MKEILKNIIVENRHTEMPQIIKRFVEIPFNQIIIISLIGARRSGKTYILYDLINKLFAKKININQILFINFEDERLNLKTEHLDLILQAYQELNPEISFNNVYMFFDESCIYIQHDQVINPHLYCNFIQLITVYQF